MKTNEVLQELQGLGEKIKSLLSHTRGSDYYNEMDAKIEYDDNPDDRLYKDEFGNILTKLEGIKEDIEYLSRPIDKIGTLRKNERGRYETDFKEFTCGNGIEILISDEVEGSQKWVTSRVEHDGKDYYVVGYPFSKMEGCTVRTRK